MIRKANNAHVPIRFLSFLIIIRKREPKIQGISYPLSVNPSLSLFRDYNSPLLLFFLPRRHPKFVFGLEGVVALLQSC